MKSARHEIGFLMTVPLLLAMVCGPVHAQSAARQKVVVHLTHYTDNLHAVTMAVHLAHMMQTKGAEVTLVLDLEGVRLADNRQPLDLVWGKGEPVAKEVTAFVKAGGHILLCPHCSEYAAITAANLRPGARIAKEGELPDTILAADKVLDY